MSDQLLEYQNIYLRGFYREMILPHLIYELQVKRYNHSSINLDCSIIPLANFNLNKIKCYQGMHEGIGMNELIDVLENEQSVFKLKVKFSHVNEESELSDYKEWIQELIIQRIKDKLIKMELYIIPQTYPTSLDDQFNFIQNNIHILELSKSLSFQFEEENITNLNLIFQKIVSLAKEYKLPSIVLKFQKIPQNKLSFIFRHIIDNFSADIKIIQKILIKFLENKILIEYKNQQLRYEYQTANMHDLKYNCQKNIYQILNQYLRQDSQITSIALSDGQYFSEIIKILSQQFMSKQNIITYEISASLSTLNSAVNLFLPIVCSSNLQNLTLDLAKLKLSDQNLVDLLNQQKLKTSQLKCFNLKTNKMSNEQVKSLFQFIQIAYSSLQSFSVQFEISFEGIEEILNNAKRLLNLKYLGVGYKCMSGNVHGLMLDSQGLSENIFELQKLTFECSDSHYSMFSNLVFRQFIQLQNKEIQQIVIKHDNPEKCYCYSLVEKSDINVNQSQQIRQFTKKINQFNQLTAINIYLRKKLNYLKLDLLLQNNINTLKVLHLRLDFDEIQFHQILKCINLVDLRIILYYCDNQINIPIMCSSLKNLQRITIFSETGQVLFNPLHLSYLLTMDYITQISLENYNQYKLQQLEMIKYRIEQVLKLFVYSKLIIPELHFQNKCNYWDLIF